MVSFAQYYKPATLFIFGDECCAKISDNLIHIFDLDCMKIAIPNLLSIAILVCGGLVKVPQIVNVWKRKSAFGISMFSLLFEILSLSLTAAYNYRMKYPFENYGECIFLFGQTSAIFLLATIFGTNNNEAENKQLLETPSASTGLNSADFNQKNNGEAQTKETESEDVNSNAPNKLKVLQLKKKGSTPRSLALSILISSVFILILAFLCQFLINGASDVQLSNLFKYCVPPLYLLSRIDQIYTIYREKATGTISPISSILIALGSLVRVFTTFIKVDDYLMLFIALLAFCLNALILVQIRIYS